MVESVARRGIPCLYETSKRERGERRRDYAKREPVEDRYFGAKERVEGESEIDNCKGIESSNSSST